MADSVYLSNRAAAAYENLSDKQVMQVSAFLDSLAEDGRSRMSDPNVKHLDSGGLSVARTGETYVLFTYKGIQSSFVITDISTDPSGDLSAIYKDASFSAAAPVDLHEQVA